MWLKEIVIKSCTLNKISESKWNINISISPLDEYWDLVPAIRLKVYVNRQLINTLMSDEFGNINNSFVVDNIKEENEVQITDASEDIKSKIRFVLLEQNKKNYQENSNSEQQKDVNYNENNKNKKESFDSDKERVFNEVSKNWLFLGKKENLKYNSDIDIVLTALEQNWDAIIYVDDFLLMDFDVLIKAYIGKQSSFAKLWTLKRDNMIITDYMTKIQNFFSSGYVLDENLLSAISRNKDVFYFIAKSLNESHNIGSLFYKFVSKIPDHFWDDEKFATEISKHINQFTFSYLPENIKNNEKYFLNSLLHCPSYWWFRFAPKSLHNKNFILKELMLSKKYSADYVFPETLNYFSVDDRLEIFRISVENKVWVENRIYFTYDEIVDILKKWKGQINEHTHILDYQHIIGQPNIKYFIQNTPSINLWTWNRRWEL